MNIFSGDKFYVGLAGITLIMGGWLLTYTLDIQLELLFVVLVPVLAIFIYALPFGYIAYRLFRRWSSVNVSLFFAFLVVIVGFWVGGGVMTLTMGGAWFILLGDWIFKWVVKQIAKEVVSMQNPKQNLG